MAVADIEPEIQIAAVQEGQQHEEQQEEEVVLHGKVSSTLHYVAEPEALDQR